MSLLSAITRRSVQPINRRSEPRTFGGAQVVLQWDRPESQVGIATVLDWATHGIRIRHRLPLLKDDVVKVIAPDWILNARVAWIEDFKGAQEAGLLIEPRGELPSALTD